MNRFSQTNWAGLNVSWLLSWKSETQNKKQVSIRNVHPDITEPKIYPKLAILAWLSYLPVKQTTTKTYLLIFWESFQILGSELFLPIALYLKIKIKRERKIWLTSSSGLQGSHWPFLLCSQANQGSNNERMGGRPLAANGSQPERQKPMCWTSSLATII